MFSLQWRHNERDGVSNHQPHNCLLNRLFRRRSKKKKLSFRVTSLCAGNSPVTVEFPAQRARNADNVSIWWRHHGTLWRAGTFLGYLVKCYTRSFGNVYESSKIMRLWDFRYFDWSLFMLNNVGKSILPKIIDFIIRCSYITYVVLTIMHSWYYVVYRYVYHYRFHPCRVHSPLGIFSIDPL